MGGVVVQGDSPSGIFLLGTAWCLSPCSVPRLKERPGGRQAGQARHRLWPRQVNLRQALRSREEAGRRLDEAWTETIRFSVTVI